MPPSPTENLTGKVPSRAKPHIPDETSTVTSEEQCPGTENAKSEGSGQHLDVPPSRPSIDTLSGLSSYSLEDFSATRPLAPSAGANNYPRQPSQPSGPLSSFRRRWSEIWQAQKGMVLMVLAQLFGAAMSTVARYMQTTVENGPPMHTFQIIFVRMSLTSVACLAYMWWFQVPDFPFGKKEVRPLLLARGFGGFFGVSGMYFSLVYLPLSEATVITFLAPMLAAWICSILIGSPFTTTQKLGFAISLAGVLLIAQPFSFLTDKASPEQASLSNSTVIASLTNSTVEGSKSHEAIHKVTPTEHLFAVGISLVGVCGAACAYTTISWIGKRAHPLISINYFAAWCTLVSMLALIFIPGIPFRLPSNLHEWMLMMFLGLSGFLMQFLLTAALAHTRGGKGLNMVYTQMLFALAFDKIVWGTTPGAVSIIGSSLILGSAVWVAMKKEKKEDSPPAGRTDEEEGLVNGTDRDDADSDSIEEGTEIRNDHSRDIQLRQTRQ